MNKICICENHLGCHFKSCEIIDNDMNFNDKIKRLTELSEINPYQRDFGENIKIKRKALNLTLRTVSSKTGVPISTISRIENGSRNLSLESFCKLSDFFNEL